MRADKTSNQAESHEAIRRQAADWIVRIDRGFAGDEEGRLARWLDADPRHREAFERRSLLWQRFDHVGQNLVHEVRFDAPTPNVPASPSQRRWRQFAAWGSLAALLALSFSLWKFESSSPEKGPVLLAEGPAAGTYERHSLPDGSVVELNEGGQASFEYTSAARRLSLIAGEAHFTVAKDPARPFIVHAGEAIVEAVGTAFNVDLGSDSVEVVVTEGRVRLKSIESVGQENRASAEPTPVLELVAGHRSSLSAGRLGAPPQVESLTPEEMDHRLNWKRPLLEFVARPLSEVVAELNRYNDTQLSIADPRIGDRIITASLRPQNLEGFQDLLEVAIGVHFRPQGPSLIVLEEQTEPH